MPRRASLKIVSRAGTPTLYVRGTVRGQSVFESAGTSDPRLAEEYRANREAELFREAVHGPAPEAKAERTLAEAVISYLEVEERSKATRGHLEKLLRHFGDCTLASVDQVAVDGACKAVLRPGATGATKLRQIVTPIRTILRHAASRGMLASLPVLATPRVAKRAKAALRPSEVAKVIRAAAPHLRPMLAFAIGTGARPAEYLDLEWTDVDLDAGRVRLTLKGREGQRKTRHCDMSQVAIQALQSLEHRTGPVFQPRSGSRYRDTKRMTGGQFKVGWGGACQRAGLPGEVRIYRHTDRKLGLDYERYSPEHTPYVLRHSWASWHYAIHRDLKLLQAEGGWESQDMLDTYVHLLPAHYRQDAADFLAGKVDLGFGEPAADRRFRAVAVQLGRTTPMGRPRRSLSA